jgi:GT2 family glycosyltransferase
MWVAHMSGLSVVFPRRFPRQRISPDELSGSGDVDQVIGAFLLIRRPLFEALDGFDERFFMYMEDVDLSYRARQLGHRSRFLADVRVRHERNVSSSQVPDARLFYMLRSRTEYARKHWAAWKAVALAGLILTIELPARTIVATARDPRGLRETGIAARRYCGYLLSTYLWSARIHGA